MLSFVWCILFYELETLEKDDPFLNIILFICLLAMLSLCCCTGFPPVAVHRRLTAAPSLIVEHGLLRSQASVMVARGSVAVVPRL